MKFVHLAPQSKIAKIKRSGIRSGNGRRGRGTYATPLFFSSGQVFYEINDQENEYRWRQIPSDPLSSSQIWKKTLFGKTGRSKHAAAFVFSPSKKSWPAELFVQLDFDRQETIHWLEHMLEVHPNVSLEYFFAGLTIELPTDNVIRFANSNLDYWGWSAKFVVQNENQVGAIVTSLIQLKSWCQSPYCIEVVFPTPIQSSRIERIVPLYRRSSDFKRKKMNASNIVDRY